MYTHQQKKGEVVVNYYDVLLLIRQRNQLLIHATTWIDLCSPDRPLSCDPPASVSHVLSKSMCHQVKSH